VTRQHLKPKYFFVVLNQELARKIHEKQMTAEKNVNVDVTFKVKCVFTG